jgi:CheY-like chemotaxis protein
MILFIDDERRRMKSHFESLSEALKNSQYSSVEFLDRIDDVLVFLDKDKLSNVDLIILDVMMPLGEKLQDNQEIKSGLRTGIFLYQEFRKIKPDLPIIIFTNISDEDLAEKIENNANSKFLNKENYFPHELVREVKKMLKL